ncbi:MAG: SRPBCC family protein [Actinomycetota bacterium]|nr:SRPBCC family protein [Actinomycetota bacterium]
MADKTRPFRASYLISGFGPERVFAELLQVDRLPEWAVGLRHARALDGSGAADSTLEVRPGTNLEFILSAAGFTHRVVSVVTVVEPPRRLEWRYEKGATGTGGWLVEEEGRLTVRMTLATDYRVRPAWLDRIAHRPFFRGLTEDLLGRSIRRFEDHLKKP